MNIYEGHFEKFAKVFSSRIVQGIFSKGWLGISPQGFRELGHILCFSKVFNFDNNLEIITLCKFKTFYEFCWQNNLNVSSSLYPLEKFPKKQSFFLLYEYLYRLKLQQNVYLFFWKNLWHCITQYNTINLQYYVHSSHGLNARDIQYTCTVRNNLLFVSVVSGTEIVKLNF